MILIRTSNIKLVIVFFSICSIGSVYANDNGEKFVSQKAGNMLINIDRSGYGIGIHKAGNPDSLAQLIDKDGDGVVDLLRYLVLDPDGVKKYEVEDYEMDGYLDQRTVFKDNQLRYFEIPFKGEWREVLGKKGKFYISVGEEIINVVYEKGIFRIKTPNE